MKKKIFLVLILIVVFIVIAYNNNPIENCWTPKCVVLGITGYKCPGCGMQRAVYSLLHGEFIHAIRYNYFAAIWASILVLYAMTLLFHCNRFLTTIKKYISVATLGYTYLITYILWWILRNMYDL